MSLPVLRILPVLLLWGGGGACSPPPAAPDDLDSLSSWLFQNFEEEDTELVASGLVNLRSFFRTLDLTEGYQDRSFTLSDLTEEDVAGLERPDVDLAGTLPVALVTESGFTPTEHADVIVLPDQTPVEPNSPDQYAREFLDPEDESCFPGRSCDLLRTMNDIIKKNALMEIPYDMNKDYRWIDLAEADTGASGWSILARSWCQEEAVGEAGNNAIRQSFSVEVFLPEDGGGIRYMGLWSEPEVAGFSDDQVVGTIKYGLHQIFEATEEYLEEYLEEGGAEGG